MNHDCTREIEAAVRDLAMLAKSAEAEAARVKALLKQSDATIADLREKLSLVEQAHRELAACHTAGKMQRVREAGDVPPAQARERRYGPITGWVPSAEPARPRYQRTDDGDGTWTGPRDPWKAT